MIGTSGTTGTSGTFGDGAVFAASDAFLERGSVSGDSERLDALDSFVDRGVGLSGLAKVIILAAKLKLALTKKRHTTC